MFYSQLNRKMLVYATEESLSILEFSKGEYIPKTEEQSGSDSSAEEESLAKNVKQQKIQFSVKITM